MAINHDTGTWQELYSNYAWFLDEYDLRLSRASAFFKSMLVLYGALIAFVFAHRGDMAPLQFFQTLFKPQFIPLFVGAALVTVPVALVMAWFIGFMGDERTAGDLRRRLRRYASRL